LNSFILIIIHKTYKIKSKYPTPPPPLEEGFILSSFSFLPPPLEGTLFSFLPLLSTSFSSPSSGGGGLRRGRFLKF